MSFIIRDNETFLELPSKERGFASIQFTQSKFPSHLKIQAG